jgi:hypothetical protein
MIGKCGKSQEMHHNLINTVAVVLRLYCGCCCYLVVVVVVRLRGLVVGLDWSLQFAASERIVVASGGIGA